MKTAFWVLSLSLFTLSCGKKTEIAPAVYEFSNSVSTESTKFERKDLVNDRSCIDAPLTKDLDSGESIKKLIVNTDLDFCNGVRLRLKAYQFSSKKYKAYGFVRSNSGHETCIRESDEFSHTAFLGDKGVLMGDNIKILLGGHEFNSNNMLVPSDRRTARYVKFEWGEYKGELAIMEKGKLRCWAIQ